MTLKKSLNDWVEIIHKYSIEKGWWQGEPIKCPSCKHEFRIERDPLHVIALIDSELGEATDAFREPNKRMDKDGIFNGLHGIDTYEEFVVREERNENEKPEGPSTELVDALIRIMDYFGQRGWDLERVLELKHKYNLTRPERHGGKKY